VPFERYRGATLIKPNRTETEEAFGSPIRTIDEAVEAAVWLCREFDIAMAVVTLDRDGMVLATADGASRHFPTEARSVYDITGAGDMVLAALGLGLAAGSSPQDAIQLANIAAGLEVEREGVAVITPSEIVAQLPGEESPTKCVNCQQAGVLAEKYRQMGKRVVFTNGCFDLLHAGHVTSLKEAASFGDVLFVGVNADETIRQLKGPGRPIIAENERMAVLAALECVQHVVLFAEPTPHNLLHAIRPDVLVKGGTYREDEVVGHEVVKSYGGRIQVTNVVDGMSTTSIVAKVVDRAA
jgi:D-beta-D-heptose 7-phosphate kinase/D-beta-D-heptose 1-phosphate adenosyltransferase